MNLRQLRRQCGWSQSDLARNAHVSRGTVVNIERGRANPSISTVTQLALALGVSPEFMFNAVARQREEGPPVMTDDARTDQVTVKLTGEDGNVFSIIGRVSRALKRAGRHEDAKAFIAEATGCGSYDEVLRLVTRTVEVE